MKAEHLRGAILQWAIEGKLVPQLDDEPAVEQIGEAPKDVPFEIPGKWKWVHMGDVVDKHLGGGTPSKQNPNYWNGSIPWASVKDLKGPILSKTIDKITEEGLKDSSSNLIPEGSVIICTRMGLGKIAINTKPVAINQDLRALFLNDVIDKQYFIFLYSTLKIEGGGTTVKGIKISELLSMPIPLPSLAEQRRIVARLNELMPLVEAYGKEQEALEKLEKEMPDKLRASLLQEAIQGKLVPQLDDEPAVEQIGEAPKEVPFEIPGKWKWAYMKDAITLISGRDLERGKILEEREGIPYITGASQIQNGQVLITRWTKSATVLSEKDDILLTCKGTVGKIALNDVGIIHIARQIMAIRCYKPTSIYSLDVSYVKYFLEHISPFIISKAKSMIPGIDRKTILNQPIPIPPLAEQRRIVARLNELLSQVDQLSQA